MGLWSHKDLFIRAAGSKTHTMEYLHQNLLHEAASACGDEGEGGDEMLKDETKRSRMLKTCISDVTVAASD